MPSDRRWCLVLLLGLLAAGEARAEPAELLSARGIARYQAGDLKGAVELLRRALEQAPESAAAGHHLGLALIRLGQLSEGRRALSAAAREDPENGALLVDLGQAYLLEGNAAWAVRVLGRASELDPTSGRARYLHGVALLRLGDAEPAAEAIGRASQLGGVDPSEAALQQSLALYMSRRYEESRIVLAPALGGPDRGAARRLLRASLSAEGRPASLLSAELAVGAVVDTNPLYEHETTAPTAAGPTLAGSLTIRPWVTSRHAIWGEVAGAHSFYFPSESSPASPSEIRAGAFYGLRLGQGESNIQISAGYTFDLTLLDDYAKEDLAGRTQLADSHHIFLEQHGGQLTLRRSRTGWGYSQLRYTLLRSQFADLARSNWGNELAFEQSLTLLGERLRLLGWVGVRYESAHAADYNQVAPGLGIGGSFLAPLGLVLGLRVGYEYRSHVDSGAGARWAEQRIDNNLAFTVELGRALPWNLRARAVYQRLQNFSTVQTYDYSRDVVSLGVSWSTP